MQACADYALLYLVILSWSNCCPQTVLLKRDSKLLSKPPKRGAELCLIKLISAASSYMIILFICWFFKKI